MTTTTAAPHTPSDVADLLRKHGFHVEPQPPPASPTSDWWETHHELDEEGRLDAVARFVATMADGYHVKAFTGRRDLSNIHVPWSVRLTPGAPLAFIDALLDATVDWAVEMTR